MSQDGYSLSATLKAGTGYEAPWIVVYGNTPAEVAAKLNDTGGLIEAVVNASNLLKGAYAAGPLLQQAPAQGAWGQPQQGAQAPVQQTPQPQQQQQQASAPAVRYHPEGIRCSACQSPVQYKTITSKAGKTFNLWSCPNQRAKNDGHFSDFAD